MRILLVNKFHWLKGGSETYYFGLGKMLKKNGHEVAYFSMKDKNNIKTGDKEYFVEASDMNSKRITKALSIIYNRKNRKKMEEALNDFKPDIVHLNNFQRQLSASIIYPIKKRNIPIVLTMHDAQAMCPAITMMDKDGNICDKCVNGKYLNCIKHKCIKNSKLKSILGAIEGKYYRIKKIYNNRIDYIITPSNFIRNKLISDGIEKNKIVTIHNYVELHNHHLKRTNNNYIFFFGRLSKEKGVINLINAFIKLSGGNLYIAGDGPERNNLEKIIKENKLEKRVKLLGYLDSSKVIDFITNCKFVVVPSICSENCPYSVLETMMVGKPIVGSNVGGIPELIINNKNGFIFDSYSIDDLYKKMKILLENPKIVDDFSKYSQKLAKENYTETVYYKKIFDIYNKAVKKNE